MKKGVLTRLIVHEILFSLKTKNGNFSEILDLFSLKYSLSSSDKKMIHNITLNSMRHNLYIKKILKKYVKKKITVNQLLLFLSAITQIVFLNFKEYAVVDCTVELAKNKKINISPSFVNAVLKNVIIDKNSIKMTKVDFNNLPNWLVGQTNDKTLYEKRNFMHTIINKPSLHIVFKDSNLMKLFTIPTTMTSEISLFVKNYSQIELLPRYKNGDWWVQDFISMLPVKLTPNLNSKKVIDLCAAPGGKSFQLLSNKNNTTMIEISSKRAKILEKNLKRLNFKNSITIQDARKIDTKIKYDCVIIDAPCSSVGTIRRNPEIFFRNQSPNLKLITELQRELLNVAKEIINKKGLIIYMVCSFLKIETINQIQKFLLKNKNFSINKFELKNDDYNLIDKNGFINTLPKEYKDYNIDGFFAAKLIRND